MIVSQRPLALLTILAALLGTAGVGSAAMSGAPTPLCGSAKPAHVRPIESTGSFRVAQFNVLHGLTTEGDETLDARLKLQVAQLAASNVDVVGMEEVSEGANHGRVITKMANRLAAKTHNAWYWCWFRNEPHFPGMPDTRPGGGGPLAEQMSTFANMHDKHWYAGQAVLSRFPIVASAVHRLPGEDARQRLTTDCKPPGFDGDPTCVPAIVFETRAAIWTRIRTWYGSVSVTAAHTSGTVAQHEDLSAWATAQSAKDDSAFLVCDCNSLPSSAAQATMRGSGWTDTYRALHPTGGGTGDQQIDASHATVTDRIDYVFVRPGSWLNLLTSDRFMNEPTHSTATSSGWLWPSDHWGVIGRFLAGGGQDLPHTG